MNNMFNDYNKILLESYDGSMKLYKKLIRSTKIYLIIGSLICTFYIIGVIISDRLFIQVCYSITSIIWLFLLNMYYKKIRDYKKELNKYTEMYMELYKVVDYPSYIKGERSAKFKKIFKNKL